jgi:hypothetical protein
LSYRKYYLILEMGKLNPLEVETVAQKGKGIVELPRVSDSKFVFFATTSYIKKSV